MFICFYFPPFFVLFSSLPPPNGPMPPPSISPPPLASLQRGQVLLDYDADTPTELSLMAHEVNIALN